MLSREFIEKRISSRKDIFILLILGKILLIPFLLILGSKFDAREFNILILPDLNFYETIYSAEKFLNFQEWVPNIAFVGLANFIKQIAVSEIWKYIIYGCISLGVMTYSQTVLIEYIFKQFPDATIREKYFSIFLSVFNFYILIYSIKPSTDVFGCLAIVILFLGLIKYNYSDKYNGSVLWIIYLLILSLFRSNIFIIIPFLFLTRAIVSIRLDLKESDKSKKFLLITLITFLTIVNIFQLLGYLNLYQSLQENGGLISQIKKETISFNLNHVLGIAKLLVFKFILLISARETIGINNDFFITQESKIIYYPLFINTITLIYLFLNNLLGLSAIFLRFKKDFINSFLFTLIPLIPLISYYTHHRYFLPYSLFTSSCLPFLFKKNKTET